MNRNLEIWTHADALSKADSVKGFEDTFVMPAGMAGFRVAERCSKHISPSCKRMNLSYSERIRLPNLSAPIRGYAKLAEGRPAVRELMLDPEATSVPTPLHSRIVAPHVNAIVPIPFSW